VYYATELTEFEQLMIEAGIEVEGVARRLFADGAFVTGSKAEARQKTAKLLAANTRTLFQPVFEKALLENFPSIK
jgi:UDP-N-acetylmuramate-alanine ligase